MIYIFNSPINFSNISYRNIKLKNCDQCYCTKIVGSYVHISACRVHKPLFSKAYSGEYFCYPVEIWIDMNVKPVRQDIILP